MEPKTDIMADARSFMKSRVILTGAELDFFTRLDGNFLTAAELIGDRDLDQRATTRILDCLVALNLLEKQDGKYRTSAAGSTLSSRHPESVLPMVRHMSFIWRNWSRLTDVAELGKNPDLRPVVDAEPEDERRSFIGAMHVAAQQLSVKIAEAFDASAYKTLLNMLVNTPAGDTYTFDEVKKTLQSAGFEDVEWIVSGKKMDSLVRAVKPA